jgi:hypothetical protein
MSGILPKLDKTMPLVTVTTTDPRTGQPIELEGIPSPQMQRFWQSAVQKADGAAGDLNGKVNTKTISYSSQTISNPPTQGEVQAINNALVLVVQALRNQ